jgi:hypothetical protein
MIQVGTKTGDYVKGLTTNSTDTSFASLVPTVTEPTGDGVITWGGGYEQASSTIMVVPFGAGADNSTFALRVTSWRNISTLWIPVLLGEFACTLSATVGVAGTSVLATDRIADTITAVLAPANAIIVSPTGEEIGYVMLDAVGSTKIQFSFDMTGATNGNVLYARL